MTTNLKPCAHCGGAAWIGQNDIKTAYFVQCEACGLSQYRWHHRTEADATTAWNTRAEEREAIEAAVSAERRRIVAELRRNMAVYEQLEQSAYTRGRNGLYKRYHELKKAWEHAMHIAEHGGSGREETAAAGDAPEEGEP